MEDSLDQSQLAVTPTRRKRNKIFQQSSSRRKHHLFTERDTLEKTNKEIQT